MQLHILRSNQTAGIGMLVGHVVATLLMPLSSLPPPPVLLCHLLSHLFHQSRARPQLTVVSTATPLPYSSPSLHQGPKFIDGMD